MARATRGAAKEGPGVGGAVVADNGRDVIVVVPDGATEVRVIRPRHVVVQAAGMAEVAIEGLLVPGQTIEDVELVVHSPDAPEVRFGAPEEADPS